MTTESRLLANRFHRIWFWRLTGLADKAPAEFEVVVIASFPEFSGSFRISSGMWRMLRAKVMQSFNVFRSFSGLSIESLKINSLLNFFIADTWCSIKSLWYTHYFLICWKYYLIFWYHSNTVKSLNTNRTNIFGESALSCGDATRQKNGKTNFSSLFCQKA